MGLVQKFTQWDKEIVYLYSSTNQIVVPFQPT